MGLFEFWIGAAKEETLKARNGKTLHIRKPTEEVAFGSTSCAPIEQPAIAPALNGFNGVDLFRERQIETFGRSGFGLCFW